MSKIAFLGAGAMGERIIHNLLKDKHDVAVYNRSQDTLTSIQEAGARIALTPKDAANGAEIIFAMVRDNDSSKAVWLGENGAVHSLKEPSVAIDMSTLTPAWIKDLASHITQTGAAFLEAPVLGTRPQAESAQLIHLIGGASETLEKVSPVLKSISSTIHHVGEWGQAAAMKLAINTQYGVQVAIWAETLAFLERQHIDKKQAVEILNTLPTTSTAMQAAGHLIASKTFMPMFPIELVEKDFAYAEEVAKDIGLDAHTLKTVRRIYLKAKDEGYGNDNIVGVAQMYDPNPDYSFHVQNK